MTASQAETHSSTKLPKQASQSRRRSQNHGPWTRIWLCSYEAGILENPDTTPPADIWKLTIDPLKAPDKPEDFTLHFEKGIPTKLDYIQDGKKTTITDSVKLFLAINAITQRNGVGRIDIVENRFIGIKSRGTQPQFDNLGIKHHCIKFDNQINRVLRNTRPKLSPLRTP